MATVGRRRRAREAALQVLFAVDASAQIEPLDVERTFEEVLAEFTLPGDARERALALALGVARHLKPIDERIEAACRHWKLSRMASVDRNILRLATFELLCESTPSEVVIDEAVEIARRFSSESAPSFVNGVLDQIARERAIAP